MFVSPTGAVYTQQSFLLCAHPLPSFKVLYPNATPTSTVPIHNPHSVTRSKKQKSKTKAWGSAPVSPWRWMTDRSAALASSIQWERAGEGGIYAARSPPTPTPGEIAGDKGGCEGAGRPRHVRRHRTETWARGVAAAPEHLNVHCARTGTFDSSQVKKKSRAEVAEIQVRGKVTSLICAGGTLGSVQTPIGDVGERPGPNHSNECTNSGGQNRLPSVRRRALLFKITQSLSE